ncbi:Bcr/CflA family multidrug efflux MFS transporter [Motiliproteus sp. MSK22-1]|uniref:Bcr/CflA family multidrug efflux MFS transporter n=1 Tax=Motiliproteus sp. MSK22-1 TaxID=1897630 RepID=UPI000976FFE0|nr:Bcr/CflA family multidrug efflux MFS transporter [Motiliproteus sp. MSK22-1]OMH33590.1 hypothetical protein BGP75_11210 [Motiliproteus sp. MSK22-1]
MSTEINKARRLSPFSFAVVGILAGLGALSLDMYLPAFPAIANSLQTSESEVQLTLSIFLIGFAAGQAIHGPLSDRFGRKPIILGGLFFYLLASIACALSDSIEQLQLARLCQGLAGASGSVLARSVIRDLYSGDELARAMSWLMLILTAGPMLAPSIGSLVLHWQGWQAIFWTLAGFALLWAVLVGIAVPESKQPEQKLSLRPAAIMAAFRSVLTHPQAIGFALCGGFAFGGMFAYIAGTPFIYMQLYDVTPQQYSGLFALNVIAMAVGSVINGRLVSALGRDKASLLWVMLLISSAVILAAAGLTQWGGLWALVIPLAFYIGTLGALAANCISGTLQFFPHISGTASSVFGVIQFGLGSFSGALLAYLNDGSALPMTLLILCFAISALLSFLLLATKPVTDFSNQTD